MVFRLSTAVVWAGMAVTDGGDAAGLSGLADSISRGSSTVKVLPLPGTLVAEALIHERTVLSSGRISSFYFDARMVTLRAEGAYLLARHILETVPADSYDAVGGMTMGADPIAAAVSALSFELGTPKPGPTFARPA